MAHCVASGRYFQGILHELLVYDRPLAPTELASATAALRDQYHISTMDCELPRPVPTLDCTALRSSCVKGTWPRGCGLSESESAKLVAFLTALEAKPATKASVPYAMAATARRGRVVRRQAALPHARPPDARHPGGHALRELSLIHI